MREDDEHRRRCTLRLEAVGSNWLDVIIDEGEPVQLKLANGVGIRLLDDELRLLMLVLSRRVDPWWLPRRAG